MTPTELFESAIKTLRRQYSTYCFFAERDVVWTVQLRILKEIKRRGLPYRVFQEYKIVRGRETRTDLVILDAHCKVELAAEFKYEPSHKRNANIGGNIPDGKLPVVDWSGENSILEDIRKVDGYVPTYAKTAYLVFIDEGSRFSWQKAPPGSEWRPWENDVSILWYVKDGSVRNQ